MGDAMVWFAAALVACDGGGSRDDTAPAGTDLDVQDADADADSDADTDADSDADSDADTDADGDTDTHSGLDPTGETGGTGTPFDADGDGVMDSSDVCPGLDDRVDLDRDALPDCSQTLVLNPQLATDIATWQPSTVGSNTSVARWGTRDASGWSGSGSAEVLNTTPMLAANAAGVTSSCVTGAPGDVFGVYYRYYLDSANLAGSGPQMITSYMTYTDGACQVPAASVTPGPPVTQWNAWATVALPRTLTMQPGWHSFEVQIALFKPDSAAPMPFLLDDVLVRR